MKTFECNVYIHNHWNSTATNAAVFFMLFVATTTSIVAATAAVVASMLFAALLVSYQFILFCLLQIANTFCDFKEMHIRYQNKANKQTNPHIHRTWMCIKMSTYVAYYTHTHTHKRMHTFDCIKSLASERKEKMELVQTQCISRK